MKPLKAALCSAALALTSFAAQATTFDFTYLFDSLSTGDGNPLTVTGKFTGDQVGDIISNIANVQVSINGTAFSGPLFTEAWNDTTGNWDSSITPVISTNVTKNNFVIADVDVSTNPSAVSNYVYFTGGQAGAITFNHTDALNNPLSGFETASSVKWSVQAETPAVPEPSTYAMLLAGLGLMGLVARRTKA